MKLFPLLALCSLVLGIAGCGRGEPALSDYTDTNIIRLRGVYGLYLFGHDLQGPESEEQLKEYLRTNAGAKAKLKLMGVSPDDFESIFVSERDGKPFRVRYGLSGYGDFPVVFEAEGVDGKRMVAYAIPRELDDAEYEAAWSGKPADLIQDAVELAPQL